MADPMTIGMIGAGVGAMMDKDSPMRGAVLGGAMGYGGGAMMGVGAGGSAAAQAAPGMAGMTGGATNNAMYGMVLACHKRPCSQHKRLNLARPGY